MTALHILVVDGNRRKSDDVHIAHGGSATGAHYARVLQSLRSDVECTLTHPAWLDRPPLGAADLIAFHGIAWTGSSLHIYNDGPDVQAQIALSRAAFKAGVPQFGSCWGLQVAAVAAGGKVVANPRGRELGIARRITLTQAGTTHPMFEGRPNPFDALAVHLDEVAELPPSASLLAGNAMSAVQAAEIRHDAGVFWGVQYHPEYDFKQIASAILRHSDHLIASGFFTEVDALTRYADDLRALHENPARRDIAWLYGIDPEVLDPARRFNELKRWLDVQVAARRTPE